MAINMTSLHRRFRDSCPEAYMDMDQLIIVIKCCCKISQVLLVIY